MFGMVAHRTLFVEAGQRFGRGTVIDSEVRKARTDRPGNDRAARLRCDCGTEYVAQLSHLCRGDIVSCGCQRSEKASQHLHQLRGNSPDGYRLPAANGMSGHPLHGVWRGMLDRCENPRNRRYRRYGGRGIRVCERWHDIRAFIADIEREVGLKPTRCPECGGRYSLDRIDNDLGYEPGNVRWSTAAEQNLNKS